MKQIFQLLSIHCALVSVFSMSSAGIVSAGNTKSQVIFSASETEEMAVLQKTDVGASLHLGTFELPSSHGRITFFDETPNARTPSISIVVVEDSRFNTLADVGHEEVSARELFLAFAPPGTKVPDRLNLHTNQLSAKDAHSPEAKKVITLHDTPHHDHDHPENPENVQDEWGNGCTNKVAWDQGVRNWVLETGEESFGLSSVFPQVTSVSEEVIVPKVGRIHGFFSNKQAIWASVCYIGGYGGQFDYDDVALAMSHLDVNGNWVTNFDTYDRISPGWMYLYHNFSLHPPKRRISARMYSYEGEIIPAEILFSGTWKDVHPPLPEAIPE